jgi:2-polyprenyl-3-methyl-5-hydroxy-6-metoxy-1,4-benzoquinol methylase
VLDVGCGGGILSEVGIIKTWCAYRQRHSVVFITPIL